MAGEDYRFQGFQRPNYTPVPDELFDELLPHLSDPELRILLYVIRRTFGFKKDADDISLRQMVEGISTRDGRVVDRGAGVSKASAARGVKGLVEKGIVVAQRNRSEEKGDEPTTYRLRFRGEPDPVSQPETPIEPPLSQTETPRSTPLRHPPVSESTLPRVSNRDTQETVKQETARQEQLEISKGRAPDFDRARERLVAFVEDFAREFNDGAALGATLTRVTNLYGRSELDEAGFVDLLYMARQTTKERSASIRTLADDQGPWPRKNAMPYFLACLERLVDERIAAAPEAARAQGDLM